MNSRARKIYDKHVKKLFRDRLRWGVSYSPGSLPQAICWARRRAETLALWELLEDAELVRIRLEPDEWWNWENLEGDSYNVELHVDTVPGGERTILAQQKEFRALVEREGVWVVITEYRLNEDDEWEHGDSIGGIVAENLDEYLEDGYGLDLRGQAIELLRKDLRSRCPSCRRS